MPLLRRFEIKFIFIIWQVKKLSPFKAYYFPWIVFSTLRMTLTFHHANVQLNEMHMHAKYQVAIFNTSNFMTKL